MRPPVIDVTTNARGTAPGYILIAPKNGPEEEGPGQDGAMILNDSGQLAWFHSLFREDKDIMDFKVQSYRGEPVLTWWEGVHGGYGQGGYVILDGSYREIARVRAGNDYRGDHHEFLISPRDTALFTVYKQTPGDLSSVGGPADGTVLDGIVQEVDIETGEVLFEWHSLDHVGLDESSSGAPKNPKFAFDYFHINSIDVDHDDNLLVSSRMTSAVYKINYQTGEVMWRLGGEKSDFEMGPGTRTRFQHDARRQPDGTITIFDNGALKTDKLSRGIVLRLDEDAMTATLVKEYPNPDKKLSGTQGNVQVLPDGNVFVGWGSAPSFSEFSKEGELLFDANFPPEAESYRAFRFEWIGRPSNG
ncbi:MAG: arylsulfotransferase family protein, partial [Rubrobacter sp.]|nr:arylsulfotransferase family protein [Rubrobacter sp.]